MPSDWNVKRIATSIGVFLLLLLLWPPFIHEPMHLLALKLQGSNGYITYEWTTLHHSTTRTMPISGLTGGFLFLLAPSLLSLAVLTGLWLTRHVANYWSHFVLASYLCFDLIINILGYKGQVSDFRFLQAMPLSHAWAVLSATAIMWFFLALLWNGGTVSDLVKPRVTE